jgi:hypothetical protein
MASKGYGFIRPPWFRRAEAGREVQDIQERALVLIFRKINHSNQIVADQDIPWILV